MHGAVVDGKVAALRHAEHELQVERRRDGLSGGARSVRGGAQGHLGEGRHTRRLLAHGVAAQAALGEHGEPRARGGGSPRQLFHLRQVGGHVEQARLELAHGDAVGACARRVAHVAHPQLALGVGDDAASSSATPSGSGSGTCVSRILRALRARSCTRGARRRPVLAHAPVDQRRLRLLAHVPQGVLVAEEVAERADLVR